MLPASPPAAALLIALSTATTLSLAQSDTSTPGDSVEATVDRAIRFLAAEVPTWRPDNGCASCHHNGDGARALLRARNTGRPVPATALADSIAWNRSPEHWDDNKGDPGFSDPRLATLQFTLALAESIPPTTRRTEADPEPAALTNAVRRLIRFQSGDGSWPIEPGTAVGSPATWGTPLATALAARFLASVESGEARTAAAQARNWLLRQPDPVSTPQAAALLIGLDPEEPDHLPVRQAASLRLLRTALPAGGWGPYAGSPPEPFDTALALIALRNPPPGTEAPRLQEILRAGRRFLADDQDPDGAWPPTTRPPGGDSEAQRIATTAWALSALLPPAR